uniref:CSON001533 protein n=1 Tax=Culicoides sonorensis TaxID=179676 RepID=A0A336KZS7_CULSO
MDLITGFSAYFWFIQLSFCSEEISRRILNGRTASEGQFPSVVYLKSYKDNDIAYMCGGTCKKNHPRKNHCDHPLYFLQIDIYAGRTDRHPQSKLPSYLNIRQVGGYFDNSWLGQDPKL